jgi:hypothetical protein
VPRRWVERLIVCNVNPGFERANPWTLNLRAYPFARVQFGQDVATYRPRAGIDGDLERYRHRPVALWPARNAHHARGGQRALFVPHATREPFRRRRLSARDRKRVLGAGRVNAAGRPHRVQWPAPGSRAPTSRHPFPCPRTFT